MEHIELGIEVLIHGVALFIAVGVAISLIGGAVGFVLWVWDRLRQEKDREIRDLNARATALNNSLQQRPSISTQTGSLSGSSGAGQSGCTPRQLYRESAEDFVKVAIEADSLRLALKQCYAQYDSLRK